MNEQDIMIEVNHMSHIYTDENGNDVRALDDVNLSIKRGEFVCIIGTNGSGKSTLAKHFNVLLQPSEGHINVCGFDTRDEAHIWNIRQHVGMVFQNPDNQSGIISRNSYALSLKLSCHLRIQIFIRHAAIRLQRLLSLPMLFISSEGNFHPYFPRIAAPTDTERGSEANPVSHDRVSPAAGLPLYCAKPGNRFSLPGKQPFLEKSAYPAFLPLYFAGIFQLFSVSQSSSSSW